MEVERYLLYRAVAHLMQACLGRLSANIDILALAMHDGDPEIGLRLCVESAADRRALEAVVLDLDAYYNHEKAIHTVVVVAPAKLPAREWFHVHHRFEEG